MSTITFLIGYMGSGKTSIAKRVSKLTGIPFIDADKAIEEKTQMKIPEIFSLHGETYFRELENDFLKSLQIDSELIVSTGGGMPCFNDNMFFMNKVGKTIYISLTPSQLASRLRISKTERPLLTGKKDEDLLAFLENHLKEREVFYNQATIIIDGNKPFEQLAEKIEELIKKERG